MPPNTSTRTPIAPILISLTMGLILARNYPATWTLILPIALCGSLIALLLSLKNSTATLWTLVFVFSATLCFWAYGSIRLIAKPSESDLELPQREAKIALQIKTVLHVDEQHKSASVIAHVLQAPPIGRLSKGDLVYAQLKRSEAFLLPETQSDIWQKGLEIRATGLLKPIPETSGLRQNNDFDRYLKNIGVHYRFDRTNKPELIRLPTVFVRSCAAMEQRFQAILQLGVPENSELANIYVTMLLGKSSVLSNEQRERYRMTGTMHFFAISGLHIGVIAAVIAQCLLLIRIPQSWSPWIGLPLLFVYVQITGAEPSAMRAFLMTAFFWLSFAFQRQHASFAALLNSAVFVLLIDPYQLWNLGFQLSYAVVASILLFGLPISLFLKNTFQPYKWLPRSDWTPRQRIVNRLIEKVSSLFAISFSAWLASLPLCALFFSFIAPAAIVINMMLVCLVTLVIISGVLSLGCGLLRLQPVSEFINHAAWLVISAMDEIVRTATIVPNIPFYETNSRLGYGILVAYFLSLCWLYHYPDKLRTHQIWIPAIILLGGVMMLHITS